MKRGVFVRLVQVVGLPEVSGCESLAGAEGTQAKQCIGVADYGFKSWLSYLTSCFLHSVQCVPILCSVMKSLARAVSAVACHEMYILILIVHSLGLCCTVSAPSC